MAKLPLPKRLTNRPAATLSIGVRRGETSSLVTEIREAKREAQRLLSELSRLEAIATAAHQRSKSDGIGDGVLKNKTKALNGWVFSLVESAIALDVLDGNKSTQLADEFIAAIDQLKQNPMVFELR